jgi:ATP:ADP antiporter, AAA family
MGIDDSGFSRIRSFLWPIYRHELIKFVPMMVLFFLISINYHLLRIAKDALVITAPHSGAEVIPFLKVWAMLPSAVIMTLLFTKMANRMNREKLFYWVLGFFLLFFAIFTLFLYPFREALFFDHFADSLQKILPAGCKGFIALIRYWMFSLFYVMAESWSNIILSVLLWGFANEVTTVTEAKRFYALFGIGVNSSGMIVGVLGESLANHMEKTTLALPSVLSFLGAKSSWDQTVILFMGIVIGCGLLSIFLFRWMHRHVFVDHRPTIAQTQNSTTAPPKPKMSFRETLRYVAKSNYLIYIALIVLAFNLIINLTEVIWKSQMQELYPEPGRYTANMSRVTFYTGLLATLGSYFLSGNVLRRLGWRWTALVTPIVMGVTGIGFFTFLFFRHFDLATQVVYSLLGYSPLALCVFFGSLQNVLSRSCKYTVFDSTKEMAFIPLSPETKLKGKSAIDGIGSRLGKSGSSLILQILLMFFATPISCSVFVFVFMLMILPAWILSIKILDKKFQALVATPKATPPVPSEESPLLEKTI